MKILEKNLLILASAGSGKTFQLGNRVIGLVAGGVAPEKIVALTFTRKAAGEFADSVLTKLADAASDARKAEKLREELAMPEADFAEALEKVVRALPRLTLGTMDSFFSKVVRGFQYELGLTGGKFDLLEGPRAEAAADELLGDILGEALADEGGDEFLHAFRRATLGKEEQKVLDGLRAFVRAWQSRYRGAPDVEWGPDFLAGVQMEDWEKQKSALAAKARRGLDQLLYTEKRQAAALSKVIDTLEQHTIGSGSLGSATGLTESVLTEAATADGALAVKYYKEFHISGITGEALRMMVRLAAGGEMAAAIARTRAVREVVAVYDALCEARLRRRGQLGFEDVKLLMGAWVSSEDARLRREAVDFRLDARHEHWLLDEFQDTSRADWLGLLPLIDEAASEGEGSMFIVGDQKQAIYAWRGGEVRLFDEIISRYSGNLAINPMVESWRSCPEVLALVNTVCGDLETMKELFGSITNRWNWENHVPTAPLTRSPGESRVEVVEGKWEERLVRLREILTELGIGEKALTCGVLLRSNAKVREVADHLRAEGFDVIEEGRREPAKDNPVGITLGHLLKWLADPADRFAREVVEMSPLAGFLRAKFGEGWPGIWEALTTRVGEAGFAGMIEEIVEMVWADLSNFGRRRAGDLIAALAELDARGGVTVGEAAGWIERLEVSQSPGAAAVQVMTIHKSKGLGFDVVVLPDPPNDAIPSAQYFTVAEGEGWLTQTPPKWARLISPEMRAAEEAWEAAQRYEAFCTLYVALTRAKRGLYVLLEPPSDKQDAAKPSLANWLARAVESTGAPGVAYQKGSPDWLATIPLLERKQAAANRSPLGPARPRRDRTRPVTGNARSGTNDAAAHGIAVHAAFEKIGWLDEKDAIFPAPEIAALLKSMAVRGIFEKNGRAIRLLREQPVDAVIDGKWLSGVIDRLHLHLDPAGRVERVEVIDFKTDRVEKISMLRERHATQMEAYGQAIRLIYPTAQVDCLLVSTHLGDVLSL